MVRICLTLIKEGRSNRMDISAAHGSFEQGWGLGSRVDHPSFHPRPFRPAWWAAGPNLQTLAARLLRSSEGPEYRRERLTTPDDDFLDLDWGPEPSANSPIVLVFLLIISAILEVRADNSCVVSSFFSSFFASFFGFQSFRARNFFSELGLQILTTPTIS